jgi:hypothetical protein
MACPREFPPDGGSTTAEDFRRAYQKVLRCALTKL